MQLRNCGLKVFLVFGLSVAFIFGGGFFKKAECKETYNLKFQMAYHTQHPIYHNYQEFIKRVKEATDGRITFTIFPSSQLIPLNEALDGLKKGTIDMLAACSTYYHGMVPEGDIDWMPYSKIGHRAEFWDFYNSDNEFSRIIRRAYLEKANAVVLTNQLLGSSGIIGRGNREFATIESLKGIKMRAAGGVNTRIAVALGTSPVTIAMGELYPALQRGTVDAMLFYAYGLRDYKFFEVAKTFTRPAVYIPTESCWINADAVKKLPQDLQDTLKRVAKEWGRWASVERWPAYEAEVEEWCKAKGVKYLDMDEANIKKSKELVQVVWDWYAAESPECKRLVELLRAEMKKW